MNFNSWLENKINNIENFIINIIGEENNPQGVIYEAMNYSLLSGGKRLRPVLLLASYELFKDNSTDVMPFACSMEMIHTYSLIHDDLPAMDNDDYRRGKLSNHKRYGEAIAILAGDGLLNKAFETGIKACLSCDDKSRGLGALNIIAKASGVDGMIGGQVVDMSGHEKIKTLEDLKHMYSLKTGAIIKSSIIAGAILGGADESELKSLEIFADKIGLAFQIEDDILDVTSTLEKLGKKTGSDIANDKITYLSFVSIEEAQSHAEQLTKEATEALSIFGDKAKYLIELAESLTKRDH
ncbi:polyprenyl synthetase family protein [Sedimentibacter hydroxybenzoicus DSM 7310]|uniref:Farnesyl diphosphate synthase n=1 Tax=Sedimentibacter hydroxybenzoicus DSM 7310 TaxID=1123245 RepID=A0A974GVY7_SEDHY|nr:farnesyl diphosphate synthase [Sedimentibacter hydroxybenzoicus]NYB73912.1 polyprenyl synthetase family protein [Sedimentibacter hydroxybenzoicus DSM 7310]